tara:strand:- start:12000 stop:14036 length:2037 start_codon:yes stop_codon:yes gene_type:complete
MFKTLLIANRGEIARRVMRTARRMGIRTVAVYSEADANAPHVREADEAVLLGPAPSAESYLRADKILEAAKQTGADAIHPGYGFLSENAQFAEDCAAAGIVFVGPSPDAIRAMGLKDRAKALMEKANVPVTPGYHGDNQDPDHLKTAADAIGYPVLIKAIAGGGGKGMRKVDRAEDFLSSLESCQREAQKSFGEDAVLIEKFITNPRHIEVQVFGDSRGRVVHMFERDCSLQRRHQKVIEEAPAPGMTPNVRAAMCSAAVQAAKAVNYVGAGTVEFIVDGSGTLREDGFYFMEMNTRLQVEHPVTEMVTGLDLVELQLKVAAGGSVPEQDQISLNGHAIEARLYAEDPASGFLPSIGILKVFGLPIGTSFAVPSSLDYVVTRVDAAVEADDEVTMYYDPMIAKLIAFSPNGRSSAIERLVEDIEFDVWSYPVVVNAGFIRRCLTHPDFAAGNLDTGFIERNLEVLVPSGTPKIHSAIAALCVVDGLTDHTKKDPWEKLTGFRMNSDYSFEVRFLLSGAEVVVALRKIDNGWLCEIDNESFELSNINFSATQFAGDVYFTFEGRHAQAAVSIKEDTVRVTFRGETYGFADLRPDAAADALEAGGLVKAPMPGKVLAVHVKAGQSVTKGAPMVVLEAMKMEHALTAPRDGVVESVSVEAGAQVGEGDALVTLTDVDEAAA